MNTKNDISRITIDLPKDEHRRLKRMSVENDTTMREIILKAIREIDYCAYDHTPNAETVKAMRETKAGIGLIRGKKALEISKKYGL